MEQGFIKYQRSPEAREILKKPNAYTLLSLIAQRAKRTRVFSVHGLKQGEAMLGDHKTCGLSQREYRTAKKLLKDFGLADFRTTNKGTIGWLTDTSIFDINLEGNDKPMTSKEQTSSTPETTNKNERIQERKENNPVLGWDDFWKQYPKKTEKKAAKIAWNKINPDKHLTEKIMAGLETAFLSEQWTKENGQYINKPAKWLNERLWENENFENDNTIDPALAKWKANQNG